MEACSRKISLSPSIDLSSYAAKTEGFSGADLQALVYNAHLDAIHETLSATESAVAEAGSEDKGRHEEQDVTYTAFGGTEKEVGKVLSRAEQASVNKRVSSVPPPMPSSSADPPLSQLELILSAMTAAKSSKTRKGEVSASSERPTVSRFAVSALGRRLTVTSALARRPLCNLSICRSLSPQRDHQYLQRSWCACARCRFLFPRLTGPPPARRRLTLLGGRQLL